MGTVWRRLAFINPSSDPQKRLKSRTKSSPEGMVMAGVDLRTVADLLGHLNIQMTMRYAHLAPAHKAAAVKKLSVFNARERKRQEAVILSSAGQENPTDTTTDTEAKSAQMTSSENIQ